MIKLEAAPVPATANTPRASLAEDGLSSAATDFARLLSSQADELSQAPAPDARPDLETAKENFTDAQLLFVPLAPAQITDVPTKLSGAIHTPPIAPESDAASLGSVEIMPDVPATKNPQPVAAEFTGQTARAPDASAQGAQQPAGIKPEARSEEPVARADRAAPEAISEPAFNKPVSLSDLPLFLKDPSVAAPVLLTTPEQSGATPQVLTALPAPQNSAIPAAVSPRLVSKTGESLTALTPLEAITSAPPDLKAGIDISLPIQSAAQAAPAGQQSPAAPVVLPAPLMAQPNTPVVTAPPDHIPILIETIQPKPGDDKSQIIVQLDPPELGRVLIDFSFTPEGLQSVTVKGESPEAMRVLRQMHFELVQALEQRGLSSDNLNFGQNTPSGRDQTHSPKTAPSRFDQTSEAVPRLPLRLSEILSHPSDRIDIKL